MLNFSSFTEWTSSIKLHSKWNFLKIKGNFFNKVTLLMTNSLISFLKTSKRNIFLIKIEVIAALSKNKFSLSKLNSIFGYNISLSLIVYCSLYISVRLVIFCNLQINSNNNIQIYLFFGVNTQFENVFNT